MGLWWLSQRSLKSCRLELEDRSLEHASLFPLFDDVGRTRMLMITAEEDGRIMLADWAPGLFVRDWAWRNRLRLRFADLRDASTWDEERFQICGTSIPGGCSATTGTMATGPCPPCRRQTSPATIRQFPGSSSTRALDGLRTCRGGRATRRASGASKRTRWPPSPPSAVAPRTCGPAALLRSGGSCGRSGASREVRKRLGDDAEEVNRGRRPWYLAHLKYLHSVVVVVRDVHPFPAAQLLDESSSEMSTLYFPGEEEERRARGRPIVRRVATARSSAARYRRRAFPSACPIGPCMPGSPVSRNASCRLRA